MPPRILHQNRRRVETHRLAVEQAAQESSGMMALEPGRGINQQREAGGVRFGKAVFAEALNLRDDAPGEAFRQAVLRHAGQQFLLEMRQPALALPGGHRAAQLVGLAGREVGGDDGQLHDLLLKNRHAAGAVEHGIDLSRFAPRNDISGAVLRQTLGLPPSSVVFGTVGRLNEAKQQQRMLVALRTLIDQGEDAALAIVGDGELRAELERETDRLGLRDRVRFLGARSDVPELLAGMDVFLLSSRTEGYSLALVEASAAALPIVATDVGGNAEIVHDGRTGLLVPAGDDDRLAAAMAELLRNVSRREQLGRQARQWALEEGSLDAMCDGYERLYAGAGPRNPDVATRRIAG